MMTTMLKLSILIMSSVAIILGWSYTGDGVTQIEELLQQMASCIDDNRDTDAS